jgi:hypothetical protein
MMLHVRRLPFALHPLIAEAKRRARHRRVLVAALILAVGAVVGATAALGGSPGGPHQPQPSASGRGSRGSRNPGVANPAAVHFKTVSAAQLADGGIHLTKPLGTSTAAAGDAAAAAGSNWFGDLKILESKFVHCVDRNLHPAVDEDCWAVSLDTANFHPVGGTPPPGPVAKSPTYLMVLVEPGSNRILDNKAN